MEFEGLKNEILKHEAKSEYKQAAIVILREIFEQSSETGQVDAIVNQPCMKSVRFEPENEPEIATIGAMMELLKDSDLSDAGKKRIIEYIADWVG